MNLVLLARRADVLGALAGDLASRRGVEVRPLACDLADARFAEDLSRCVSGLDVGVAVYNAAYSFVAPLMERPLEDALRVVDVNVRGPLRFAHTLVPAMIGRGRGALVLMSSLAGFQGSPKLSVYAASKAFNMVLGESLWAELAPSGIDVLASCAGAIRTPGYGRALQKEAPGTLDAADVVEQTLAGLGHGPVVVPGGVNKLATFFMRRLATRKGAIGIMGKSVSGLE
jgi:short-subunit dehydrogenase